DFLSVFICVHLWLISYSWIVPTATAVTRTGSPAGCSDVGLDKRLHVGNAEIMKPPAVSSPAGGKICGPLDPIKLPRPAIQPTMLRFRPGNLAVLLSLTCVGLIVPAPVARASDPPRVSDAATL